MVMWSFQEKTFNCLKFSLEFLPDWNTLDGSNAFLPAWDSLDRTVICFSIAKRRSLATVVFIHRYPQKKIKISDTNDGFNDGRKSIMRYFEDRLWSFVLLVASSIVSKPRRQLRSYSRQEF